MKKGIKITAAALAVLASAGATAYYAADNNKANADSQSAVIEPRNVSAVTDTTRTASAEKAQKDETVYVLADATGTVTQTIVSDWLKNTGALKSMDDISDLSDIINVKGSQAYTSDGSSILWDAQGADIYYRGTSTKQVPVTLTVTYTLDGKEIQPEELAGKSGHVKIRYDYTNHEKQSTLVGDSREDLYVPYLLSTVTALDSDKFENITLSNGKVLSDGSKVMVMGVAFPGLKESLGITENTDIDIPDYFEIEADVTDFELETSITVASSEIFSELDIDADSTVDDLKTSIQKLSDASEELCDGTKSLYDGIQELSDGTAPLTEGIQKLASGVAAVNTGASDLASGASDLSAGTNNLLNGAADLSTGLNALDQGMQDAKNGAEALADGTAKLTAGVSSVSDGLSATKEGLDTLADGMDTAAAALQTSISYEQTIMNQLLAAHPDYATGTPASGDPTEADWITFQSLYASVQYQQSVYNSLTTVPEDESVSTLRKGVSALQAGNSQLTAGVAQLADGIGQANDGAGSLQSGLTKLAAASSQLSSGASDLYAGTKQANDGANQLSNGANQLASGVSQVSGGVSDLQSGSQKLISGTSQLKSGASQLNDGMNEFNETGIQKLSDAINGDFTGYLDRFKALKNLSADYGTFSGLSDDMDGKVTFIYTTDSILSE